MKFVASLLAVCVTAFALEASACPVPKEPWEDAACDVFAPRPVADGAERFSWSLASHDERRDYLVASHVPYPLADKLAVGGVPLQGQTRAGQPGWFLVPSLAPRAVLVFE